MTKPSELTNPYSKAVPWENAELIDDIAPWEGDVEDHLYERKADK